MGAIDRHPEPGETLFQRAITGILRFLFKNDDGYDVDKEDNRERSVQDLTVLKEECRAGSSTYEYDFLIVEYKEASHNWDTTLEHLTLRCENTKNQSGQVYGMAQVA
ncbi:hypothetical protein BGZ63DRAFT_401344 [Mariannaea sp. PMI_226]|nr:hypothetical protein BGZ63DRAFT_401344 [Mariannaea sp. PMI_226]